MTRHIVFASVVMTLRLERDGCPNSSKYLARNSPTVARRSCSISFHITMSSLVSLSLALSTKPLREFLPGEQSVNALSHEPSARRETQPGSENDAKITRV